jgi:hypothetical protein
MSELWQADNGEDAQIQSLHDERRLVARVLRHWTEMGTGRGFPRLIDIDPWMVGDDWTNCLLVAVRSPIEDSRFVVVGDNLLWAPGIELDGATIGRCPRNTPAGVMVSNLRLLVPERRGLIIEGQATHRGAAILYRGALLPLSEDGVLIDHVLGAANHRLLRPEDAHTASAQLRWL